MSKTEVLNNEALTVRVNADGVSDAVEGVVEELEETAERVVTIVRSNPVVVAGVAVVALGVGGYVGYRFGVKHTTLKYETILEDQIAEAKEFYARQNKAEGYETPEKAAETLGLVGPAAEAIQDYQGKGHRAAGRALRGGAWVDPAAEAAPEPVVVEETVTVEERNVFADRDANPQAWDYNLEVADREANPGKPYVISFEEFNEGAPEQEQTNLSYFAGDDVLTDSRDQPIDNTDYTVGDDNLTRFGHGSGDGKIVYVRNEKLGLDFEIIRSEGNYSDEVTNTPRTELRHSDTRNRRFRGRDE